MIAAQYETLLPADYDMGIIRNRVATHGSALDDRAGLGLKAYLIREIADGSPVNSYSPFYLWNDPDAFAAFHWGGQGFSGFVRDFGRPIVRTWIGGSFHHGSAFESAPRYAQRVVRPLPQNADPVDRAHELKEKSAAAAAGENVHSFAWGIDPTRWQSVEFTLLSAKPNGENHYGRSVYELLHLSTPEINSLP